MYRVIKIEAVSLQLYPVLYVFGEVEHLALSVIQK